MELLTKIPPTQTLTTAQNQTYMKADLDYLNASAVPSVSAADLQLRTMMTYKIYDWLWSYYYTFAYRLPLPTNS